MSDSEEDGAADMLCAFCGRGKDVEDICGTLYTEKLKTTYLAAHKKCMQYSSGLDQHKHTRFGGFYLDNVQNEIKRGKRLNCFACKLTKKKGATSGCEWKACRRSFHFYCAHQHPHSRTCRRRRRDTGEHLYWVFCSEEHREEYLKTDQGKQEESCSETDNEADDEADDEDDDEDDKPLVKIKESCSKAADKDDDDEDDKPLVKIKESCSEAADKDDDDEDDKPLVRIKESCSEAADKDDDDEDDTSEDQDHVQGNTIDKGLPMTSSECSEHSDPAIWVYTEGSSAAYDTGHSSGSFGSNLDALFPSLIGQRNGWPSATAGPAHTSAASERVGRKKKQVKRPATHDETKYRDSSNSKRDKGNTDLKKKKAVKRPATHDETKHRDSSNSKRDKGNRDRKKKKAVKRPATHDETKHRDSSNSKRDKGNRDRKKKKAVKRPATDDETKHRDSSNSNRDKGNTDLKKKKAVKRPATDDETKHRDSSNSNRDKENTDLKKKKAVKRPATHDETKHRDSSNSNRDKGNTDLKKKKAVKRLATHDETKHRDSSNSNRDKGNTDFKKKKVVKRPATHDETKQVKKLATNDETKKVKRLATDDETKHRDSSNGKRQKGNIQRKKSQKQKWKANGENDKQNASSNDSKQNLELIIISSDESEENRKHVAGLDDVEENRKHVAGLDDVEEASQQDGAPVKAQTTSLSKMAVSSKDENCRAVEPGRHCLRKQRNLPSPGWESLFCDSPRSSHTTGEASELQEQETSGDMVSVVHGESEASGDMVSVVHTEPETSGDMVSVVYPEPETSGDMVSVVHGESETSGDMVSVVHTEPETSGDMVSVVHPEPETSGDMVSVVHPEPETSGDMVSVVHTEPETSGDMVSVVHTEPETSGDMVSVVHPEPETSGDMVSVVHGEPETSGDMVSVVHTEPETSGDMVSVVHPVPETSGDMVSVVHGEPETSGDMVSVVHGEPETSGDMVSVVHGEPETSGDMVSVVHGESETSGDMVSVVHGESETSGDMVSVVHPEPETSGDMVSVVHGEPETSGDMVSVVHTESETSGDMVSVVHPEPETSGDMVSVVHPEPETSGDMVSVVHDEPETSGDMVPDSLVHATACKTQAMACADVDTCEVDEERWETALSDSKDLGLVLPTSVQDSSECLLVIPEDYRGFEGVKEELREKLALDFGIRYQHVHLWDSLHPWDLLPSEGILAYFQQIATAVMEKNWEELEELLLSVDRVQQGREAAHTKAKDYSWLIKERRQQSKEDLRKVIEVTLRRACQKNQYMMGLFCCNFTPCYISFFINNICDPQQNVRCALHHSRVHALGPDPVRLSSFHTLSPQHLDYYMQMEFEILHHWLKTRFPEHSYQVTCVPEDQVFRLGPDEGPAMFQKLKCELESDSSSNGVPLIVFMCRIKTNLIHFDSYLQACLSRYAKCASNLHVACVLPVDNFDGKWTCPQLDLDSPDCMVKTFSAFCPSRRPVTVLVVELSRAAETCGSQHVRRLHSNMNVDEQETNGSNLWPSTSTSC